MSIVEDGRTVMFHFTGTLPNGEVFASSLGESPMEVRIGAGQVIPGLESGIMGMRVGETRTFTIAPEQAYGERDEVLCQQVEKSRFPEPESLEAGMLFRVSLDEDRSVTTTIREVGEEHVLLDLNHPLAGKELTFEVECMEIRGE
jgi:peptidylprolyl isomerase